MATVPKIHTIRDGIKWIEDKKALISSSNYGTNMMSARNLYEEHKEIAKEIHEFKTQVDKFSSSSTSKLNGTDFTIMEASYSSLRELSEERQKCLETLLHIAEIEEYYQTLSAEVDSRALSLSSGPCPADNPSFAEDHESQSRTYNACIYAVRNTWSWLSKATMCMEVHLQNAAAYHEFYHELKHCDQGMQKLLTQLRQTAQKEFKENTTDVQEFIKDLRELTRQLLEYQSKTESIYSRSGDVIPLKLRKEPLETPVKATALVPYYQKDVTLEEGEEVLVLDNSQVTKWRIKTSKGDEAVVPAIVLLIPPPNRDTVHNAQRVRQQLLSTWRDCLLLLKRRAGKFFSKYLNNSKLDDMKYLTTAQREEVTNCLGDINGLIAYPDKELRTQVESWHNSVKNIKDTVNDRRGVSKPLLVQWRGNQKLLRHFEELRAYVTAYEEEINSTRESQHFAVSGKDGKNKFVSNAYIERLKPVELDGVVEDEETRIENVRHMTLAEKAPLQDENKNLIVREEDDDDDEEFEIEKIEEWTVERSRKMDSEDFEAQTIRETKTFIIIGVIDPRNGETISIYEAINEGIVSQTKGVYVNPDTGTSIPIPEAMHKGFIIVEYTNTSLVREKIQRGIITTTTTMESVSYSVQSVLHPVTGELISVLQAVEEGIIDPTNGRYINPTTGENISVEEAIERGLMTVFILEKRPRKGAKRTGPIEEITPLIVSSVYDPKTDRHIPLQDAIEKGLVDPTTGTYIDPVTGEAIPLTEASHRGVIKARLADPMKDHRNSNLVTCRVIRQPGDEEDGETMLSQGYRDINAIIFSKLRKSIDLSKPGVREETSGREMTIGEAFDEGILSLNPVHLKNASGDKYTLHEAAALGIIDSGATREILSALSANDLEKMIEEGIIDANTGMYVDPKTGEKMSIVDAIKAKKIDPDKVFFIEIPTKNIQSLSSAIDQGKFNPATGKIVDPKTGNEVTLAEALEMKLIDPSVDRNKVMSQVSALKVLKKHMSSAQKGVINPITGEEISLEEAIMMGVVDIANNEYVDPRNGQSVPLTDAVVRGLIDPKVAKQMFGAIGKESLSELLEQNCVDPKTGKYIDPDTNKKMTMQAAIDEGKLDPSAVFTVDPSTGQIASLASLIQDGKLNPETGKVIDPKSGREMSLSEAIANNFIDPHVDSEKVMAQISALKMLSKHMDTSQRGVRHPITGEDLSVEEALMLGILDIPHNEYVHTGRQRRLSLPEAVAEDLVEAKVARDVYEAISKETLGNLMKSGLIDPKSGKFIHPETGKKMTIKDAIEQGLLDPNAVYLIDPATGHVTSIGALIEQSKFNPETGKVMDPKSGKEVSLNEAIAKKLLNPDVDVDTVATQMAALKALAGHVNPELKGLKHPTTGEDLTIEEAVMLGVLDLTHNEYVDPVTGQRMSFPEAMAKGLIDPQMAKELYSAMSSNSLQNHIESNNIVPVDGIYTNPDTNEQMSIHDAIEASYLDPKSVFLVDPKTGEVTTMQALIEEGKFDPNTSRVIDPDTGRNMNIADAIDARVVEPAVDVNDIMGKIAAVSLLKKHMDTSKKGIKHPKTGEELSVEEAIMTGVVDIANNEYIDPRNGQSIPLTSATVRGVIDPTVAKQMFGAIGKESLSELLEQNCVDPKTGKYIDPDTKKKMNMQAAIDEGRLDPSAVFTMDPSTGQIASLASLIKDGKLNPETGKVIDPMSGKEMTLSEAIANNFIDPHVDSEKVMAQISALKMLSKHMDTSQRGVRHPITGEDLSVEEALMLGILDIPHNEYVHTGRQRRLSLPEAVAEDLVEAKVAKDVYEAISKETLGNLIESGRIDPKSGKFIHPETGKKMTIKDAIEQGLLDPNAVYLIDPTTGHVTSISALIEQGKFNPETGKVMDPKSGKEVALSEAIAKKLLNPDVDVDTVATQMAALKALAGHVNPELKGLKHPTTGEDLTIEEAVMLGVLDLTHNEYVDPVTGQRMSFPEAMAKGLIDPQMVKELYSAMSSNSLQNHIESNNIDPVDGTYTHPDTNEQMSIHDAIQAGYLDPKSVFLVDPKTGQVTTMQALIEEGKFDPKTSRVIDPDTGRNMNIADAIDARVVEPAVDVNDIMGKIAAVSLLKKHMDTSKKGIKHPNTGEELSVEEAIMTGVVDIASNQYIDPRNGQSIPLTSATVRGVIDPTVAKQMFGAIGKESLSELLEQNCVDPKSGTYTDPDNKKKMTMQAAIDEGKLNPSAVFTMDPSTGQIASLATLIQDGKLNPETGKVIDTVSGREMTLSEAIANNFIDPHVDSEKVMAQISALKMLGKHMDTSQRGVRHPITGEDLSVEEALMLGILDIPHNEYVHTGRQRRLSLPEAVAEDLVEARVARDMYEAISKETLGNLIESGRIDPKSGKFIHPETGKKMTIKDAIEQGLLDPNAVYLIDSTTGHVTSIGALIEQGKFNPETGKVMDPKSGKEVSLNEAIAKKLLNPDVDVDTVATQMAALKALAGHVNPELKGLKHPTTGVDLTIEEAVMLGVLDLTHNEYVDPITGQRMSFPEAMAKGLIDPQMAKELYSAMSSNSLQNHIESNNIDPVDGTYTHPDTNEQMSIHDAIQAGYLNPKSVFLVDPKTGEVTTMQALIEEGKFDPNTSRVIDPDTGRNMNIADAIDARVVEPAVDVNNILGKIAAVSLLKKHMDTSKKGIKHSITGEELSVEEAIMQDILDLPHNEYVNIITDEALGLPDAVSLGFIDPQIAKEIYAALGKESLGNLLDKNLIDPNSGKYIHPDTKRRMTIKEAIDGGHLNPNAVFMIDPQTGQVKSLSAFIDEDRFNPQTGKFKDPLTGLEVSIANALKKGIIEGAIDPEQHIESKGNLSEVIESKTTSSGGTFKAPDGTMIPLKEAIALGYLSPDTVVKTDPKTGVVTLADPEAEVTVMALMDTTEALDWVGDIETAIAQHQAPAEELLELEEQLSHHMNLKNEVEARQEPLEELLVKANELMATRKDAQEAKDSKDGKDTKKDPQTLRLRANANDLKARMQAVSTELDGRVRKLEDLRSDLENFHNHLDNMESWLGDAENELATIKQGVPSNDLGPQFMDDFSDFNEGAINKENDLDSINKSGKKLKDKAKEFCKDAEKFRNSVAQPVDKEDVNPGGVIDEQLEATNAKYKSLVAECGDLMTRLTDTAAKNKAYNELKARLAETLPQMEARVRDCSDDVSVVGAQSNAAELLEALKGVTSDVIAEGKLVEDMRTAGEDIIAILEELDCKDTPKAREIADTLTAVQGRFDTIQEELVDKQHKVNAAIVQSQDVNHNLDSLLGWVNETEAVFDNMAPVSLDREGLNEQMQAHKMLVRDVQNQREKADNVATQCQGSAAAAEKVEQLMDRFDILESRAQQRTADLEAVGQRVNSIYGQINQMEGWLNHALTALKRESVDGSPQALKDKIESMYRQKQSKQEDMDTIKRQGRELVEDPNTGDKHQIREALTDVQSKWHDLTENLVSMISFAALREIDELLSYLDRAENEINTAEAISTDPETLAAQLRDHKAFHDDLESKKRAVNATIQKCNKLLRETTNAEADDVKTKLDSIRNQADIVCKLSQERLSLLEEALPLAGHFSETQADLQSWLGEIEAEISSLEVPAEAGAEQIRKQLENAKTTQRIIEDHKPLVEDLNSTGHELSELCSDEDASDLKEDVDNVNGKYDEVKGAIREKLTDLDDALRSATTDVGDTIDGLLEELHYINNLVEHADPIAANPDALREQITENNTFVDDVERRLPAIASAKETVRNLTPENSEEYEDLRGKLQDLDVLQDNINQLTRSRGQDLDQVLGVSERFTQEYSEVIRSFRDIQDNLLSQDSPGVDPSTISEQLRELAAIQDELEKTVPAYEEVRETGALLESLCGTPGKMELQKHMEDLDLAMEDISEGLRDRQDELNGALEKAERFNASLQSIMQWLPKAEGKFESMAPVAADPRAVRIQIEELKVFNVQVKPHYIDIQALNQYASELKNASPITAESLTPQVKEVNERWNHLLGGLQDREEKLKDQLVRLGEIDHALDDIIGYLTQTEVDLQDLDNVYGDPKFVETHLKKLQLIIKDLKSQERIIKKLNKAVDEIRLASGEASRPLREKQAEMNEYFRNVRLMARDKQNQLQDILKEVKAFIGDVEDLTRWMTEFKQNLRSSAPMGALPETAEKEFHKYMGELAELERKEEEVTALLINGEDMLARCREGEADQLSLDLEKLKEKTYDARDKAERKRRKLEEHLANVKDFHAMLKIHTDWLSNAEKVLGSFKHPSKLVDRVLGQIQEHKEFKADIEAHREIMMNLDRTGTYLKYFGRKQDTVYIKNLLISIKLRWKKLVRRAEEKGRMLQQAHKEDKRFYDCWKTLCDWLDESEKKLKKYTSNAPSKVKQDIDELKHFQHQLSSKHPVYYSTMRLGRSLKDRCTKADPERDILQNMLEELKNRWTIIRSIVSQRQNKLDEALLSSGRFSDALASLLEWLGKAEAYLSEDQPILGDLDTVNILIEQHKAFQQELESRQTVVQVIKQSPAVDQSLAMQLEELNTVWDRVNRLTDVREARLQDALKLAEDFNEAVQVVREWLPQAETVLKFRALPDDEDAIVNLMEQHDRFQEDLRGYQPNVERIKYLAEEILQTCHPNAVRFVKYYLTITQTRWEQAVNRSNQRSERLHEALRNIRGNAALLEELLAWLTEAQALLSTKEKDPYPEDLTVVEALAKEHMEFHDDLSQKNKDVERLTKMTTARDRKVQFGSQYKLNESDSPSQRVTTLQNRWRNVWRMSVDRKKRLQDSLDTLLELESFKNFDFDLWRQRYIAWIRAKKLRITDFFRRQDKNGDGSLTRDEFVNGMLISKFPTNRTELNAVFDIFDRNRSGELDYREFVDALRPERQRSARARAAGKRPVSDNELIHDEIEQQVSRCQCRRQFKIQKIDNGKYKFGDKQKICLVRFLNNTVMVRVGGGWVTLAEFLDQNDPCKAKGRTNSELREQFFLPEGVSQSRANFTAKRRGSTPASNGTPRSNTSSVNNSPSASLYKSPGLTGSTGSVASDRSAASSRGGLGAKRRSKLAASWSNLSTKPLTLAPTEKAKSGSMSNLANRRHSTAVTTPTESTPRRKASATTPSRTPKTAANGTKSRLSTTNGRGTHSTDKRPKSPTARTPTTPKKMSAPTTPKK